MSNSENIEVVKTAKKEVKETPKEAPKEKLAKKSSSETKAQPAAKAAPVAAKASKRISFEQWATRRGVRTQHRGGLRAYCLNPNKSRTVTEWDVCFQDY